MSFIKDELFGRLVDSLTGQKWLEDDRDGYYCPQDWDLCYFDQDGTEAEIRFQLLVFDDWEIKQMEQFPGGLVNEPTKLSFNPSIPYNLISVVPGTGIEYTITNYKYDRRKKIIEGEILIKI